MKHGDQARVQSTIQYRIINMAVLLRIMLLIFLLGVGTTVSAQTCGNITYTYPNHIVETVPIEDCANPFNATDPEPFTVQFMLAEQAVAEGSVITVSPDQSVSGSYEIGRSGNSAFRPFQLFRLEDTDYSLVATISDEDFTLDPLAAGEYTAVFLFEELIQVSEATDSWWSVIRDFLLPATAHAFFPDHQLVVTRSFTVVHEAVEPAGASSVLFLPGIQASRLYTEGTVFENQLWEPNRDDDVEKLAMTEDGASIFDVYTREIIDEVNVLPVGQSNVYKSFMRYLDDLVDGGTIAAWEPFAYDWRHDVFSVVEEGTLYRDDEDEPSYRVYPIDVLTELASTSHSGRVTIVAHSNGGLLAKALMLALEAEGKAGLVDEVVFIASPQLGTPKAVGSVLHGYDQGLGFNILVTPETARTAMANMPGVYGLLPSSAYFDATKRPVVFFDGSEGTADFRTAYGNAINTQAELQDFLVGEEGRASASSIEAAALANSAMVDEATTYHADSLDSWIAPDGVGVIEIVGVGRDTEWGFEYREFKERICAYDADRGDTVCPVYTFYKPVPLMTKQGDETVIADSADAYGAEKRTYYLDLDLVRQNEGDSIKHANITEFSSVRNTIGNLLIGAEVVDPYMTDTAPDYSEERLMIGVHSPVSLAVETAEGDRVGIFEGEILEEVLGSSYRELAGSKYVILPAALDFTVAIDGEAEGGMTLTLHTLQGDSTLAESTIPVEVITPESKVTFSRTAKTFSDVIVDEDGDGEADYTVEVIHGPSDAVSYQSLQSLVRSLELAESVERNLLRKLKKAEKISLKPSTAKRIAQQINKLEQFKKLLDRLERKGKISPEDAAQLRQMGDELLNKL